MRNDREKLKGALMFRMGFFFLAILVLVSSMGLAGCWDGHKAAVAMKDFADSLEAVQTGFQKAHADGFLDDASYKADQTAIGQIAQGGEDVTAALKAGQKTTAAQKFDVTLQLIDQLDIDGVAHIKNSDRQAAVSALILGLRGLVTTAEAFAQ